MQETKTIQFGAKHFQTTMENRGNGIVICTLAKLYKIKLTTGEEKNHGQLIWVLCKWG